MREYERTASSFLCVATSSLSCGVRSVFPTLPPCTSREETASSVGLIIAALGTKAIEKNYNECKKHYDTHDVEDRHPAFVVTMAALLFLAFAFIVGKVSNEVVPDVHTFE